MRAQNKILALLMLLSFSIGCNFITSVGNPDTLLDCYKITFLGTTENSDGTSIWNYSMEELACAQDLSNWMLEIPACATVANASPAPWEIVQPDPNFHFNGIKWQTGAGFESGEFSVVLSGNLISGTVKYGVKGPDVAIGVVEGPVCDIVTSTATGGVTPSSTTVVDLTPSLTQLVPTVPAVPIQPPASSGTILVTDNDQTLTFTCNGNAVEVRGNANTITLLGSCGSITVKGNANVIYYSGSPVITNTGNENTILQR